jgi:hypothetical protein
MRQNYLRWRYRYLARPLVWVVASKPELGYHWPTIYRFCVVFSDSSLVPLTLMHLEDRAKPGPLLEGSIP